MDNRQDEKTKLVNSFQEAFKEIKAEREKLLPHGKPRAKLKKEIETEMVMVGRELKINKNFAAMTDEDKARIKGELEKTERGKKLNALQSAYDEGILISQKITGGKKKLEDGELDAWFVKYNALLPQPLRGLNLCTEKKNEQVIAPDENKASESTPQQKLILEKRLLTNEKGELCKIKSSQKVHAKYYKKYKDADISILQAEVRHRLSKLNNFLEDAKQFELDDAKQFELNKDLKIGLENLQKDFMKFVPEAKAEALDENKPKERDPKQAMVSLLLRYDFLVYAQEALSSYDANLKERANFEVKKDDLPTNEVIVITAKLLAERDRLQIKHDHLNTTEKEVNILKQRIGAINDVITDITKTPLTRNQAWTKLTDLSNKMKSTTGIYKIFGFDSHGVSEILKIRDYIPEVRKAIKPIPKPPAAPAKE